MFRYRNLQEKDNIVKKQDMEEIWTPDFLFRNTETRPLTSVLSKHEYQRTELNVMNYLDVSSIPSNIHYKDFVYNGSNVVISKHNIYNVDFICNFNLSYYPFDSQHCHMDLMLVNAKLHQINPSISIRSELTDFTARKHKSVSDVNLFQV